MKFKFLLLILSIFLVFPVISQEIVTAVQYLDSVSAVYGGIRDFEANVNIRSGNNEMIGNLSYLSPYFLRIDFDRPRDQVINFNGELLTVYIPEYRAVLTQAITPSRRPAAGASGAQGLALLRRNYTPNFLTGPAPVPLDANSQEMVVKIRLLRRFVSEGFVSLILSINPETKMLRRIEGDNIAGTRVQMDFHNIRTNVGIPALKFQYNSETSAGAYLYNNFLFRDTD